ncbi:alcohol dehydrogenase catalytic domain-containing protein [Streptomyces sp. NPDC093109]|uniref:zinc-dependent alcohol dehydrogenase n=1 Tax=Streptomyces sp. NPDC093109 TaxID=3154977 RepID=UPI00344DE98C
MHALIFQGPDGAGLQERPLPEIRAADDVRVDVVGTGICGTDRKILLGHFPARPGVVLGHESVGLVAEVGAGVRSLRVGDRVVVNPTLYCGTCRPCGRGATNHCLHKAGTEVGVDRDGTYAASVVLPERFVERVPEGLPFRSAVLIEPLACVLNNVEAAQVGFGDAVAVLGAGPIGTLTAVVAARAARRVVLADTDAYRAETAAGLTDHVLHLTGDDPVKAMVKELAGTRPDVVFETTGSGLETALELVADGGRIVVMGFDDTYTARLRPLRLTNHGIRIIGAGDYRADTFQVAVELAGELGADLGRLVTHELPLDAYPRAFGILGGIGGGDVPGSGASGYRAMKVVLRSDVRPAGADGWPVSA